MQYLRIRDRLDAHLVLNLTAPMPKRTKATSVERLKFLEPMYAGSVQQLSEGEAWNHEVKLDGYRCLAGRDSTGVTLWSRRGNQLTSDFPLIVNGR